MTPRPAVLSPRQSEALDLLALGLRDKEIACRMGVSPHTVKELLALGRSRLGLAGSTRVELAEAWRGRPG